MQPVKAFLLLHNNDADARVSRLDNFRSTYSPPLFMIHLALDVFVPGAELAHDNIAIRLFV
jgi:hypothetical protein